MFLIHIGLRKAGSTSIQRFLKLNRARLAAAGVLYPSIGFQAKGHHLLAQELRSQVAPGYWAELAAYRKRKPNFTVLLSSEMFEEAEAEEIARIRETFPNEAFEVLLIIRPHAALIPSLYAQRTRIGNNLDDFDAFFQQTVELRQMRYSETAKRWAKVFGWDALRVRLLDRATLKNGDLVEDFMNIVAPDFVVGEDSQALEKGSMNAAPGWKVLELLRALYTDQRRGANRNPMLKSKENRKLLQAKATEVGDALGWNRDKGSYLTEEQLAWCERTFTEEVAALNEKLIHDRIVVPTKASSVSARSFLPSAEQMTEDEARVFYATLRAWTASDAKTQGILPLEPTDKDIALVDERERQREEKRESRRAARQSERALAAARDES